MITTLSDAELRFIDKPLGWTSHQVVNWVRTETGERRVGHTGTLDPLATGLLIILVGRQATKHQDEYLKLDKRYEWEAQLGVISDTYDSMGEIEKSASDSQLAAITEAQVEQSIKILTGKIEQVVPAFSAIKREGKKLYELARAGKIETEFLPTRLVDIYSHELTEIDWRYDALSPWHGNKLLLRGSVHCGSGTYVRSLVHDLGQLLGVGAIVTGLRRTAIGPYKVELAEKIPDL